MYRQLSTKADTISTVVAALRLALGFANTRSWIRQTLKMCVCTTGEPAGHQQFESIMPTPIKRPKPARTLFTNLHGSGGFHSLRITHIVSRISAIIHAAWIFPSIVPPSIPGPAPE
jgi:hypothetical protein